MSPLAAPASPNVVYETNSTPPPSGVSRLVQLLFGREDPDAALAAGPPEGDGPDGPERVSVCRHYGPAFEEALADVLQRSLPDREPRSRWLRWARQIRREQRAQAEQLYANVLEAEARLRNPAATFRIMENLFCVLEDHSIPLPPGFAKHFCSLGFQVLSPTMFLQYVERQVFFLTDDFIRSVLSSCEDAEMRFMLISRIRNMDVLISTLWADKDNAGMVVEHLVSMLGIALPEHDVDLLEGADDALFIPLAVFQEHVRSRNPVERGDEMIAFVYEHVKRAVMKSLNI